jgi:hypothetical protein
VQEFHGYNLDLPPSICNLTSTQQQLFMVKVADKLPRLNSALMHPAGCLILVRNSDLYSNLSIGQPWNFQNGLPRLLPIFDMPSRTVLWNIAKSLRFTESVLCPVAPIIGENVVK